MPLQDDVAKGANQRSSVDFIMIQNTPTWVVGPSEKRRSITFSTNNSGQMTLSNNPNITGGQGFVITLNSGPLTLDVERHGQMVRKPWWAIHNVGNLPLGVAEVFAD